MKILGYLEYKNSFFAFAGECSKDEYLAALSDYDFLEKFNDYLYEDLPERETEEWEELDSVNTEYCEKLYEEIGGRNIIMSESKDDLPEIMQDGLTVI